MTDDPVCATVRDSLAAYAAGLLPVAEQRQIERHLAQCERCSLELRQWRQIGALAREDHSPAPTPAFADAWAQLHQRLTSQAEAASQSSAHPALHEVQLDDLLSVAPNEAYRAAESTERNQIDQATDTLSAPGSASRDTMTQTGAPITPTARRNRPFIALAATVVIVALAVSLFAMLGAWHGGPTGAGKVTPTIIHTVPATPFPTLAPTAVPINSGTGLPEGLDIISLQMLSADDGWAVGGTSMIPHSDPSVAGQPQDPTEGAILRYTNGRWELATSVYPNIGLNSVTMLSDTEGWVVGSTPTSDGGFQVVILHDHNGVWSRVPLNMGGVLYQVTMLSADEGWAIGKGTGKFGSLTLHYLNGSWTPVTNPFSLAEGVSMVSATDGWLVDDLGAIGHYQGESWSVWSQTNYVGFSAVQMLSATDGWAIGDYSPPTNAPPSSPADAYNPYVAHFDGSSWRQVSTPGVLGSQLIGLTMLSPSQGWIVGDVISANVPNQVCAIMQYSNGQWTNVPISIPGQLNTVSMVSATDGWAAGYSLNSAGVQGDALLLHDHNGVWSVYSPQG